MNPSKLHPAIMDYIDAVDWPGFHVDFYGDSSVNPVLENQVRARGAQSRIRLHGFCEKPQNVLPEFDLFIYLLNPTHYGTTENGLLEAMACGAIPVVLNNPVESGIIQHGVTGFVVESPQTFAATIRFLLDSPDERRKIRRACADAARRDFSIVANGRKLDSVYHNIMAANKKTADFSSIFGQTGSEIFMSCLGPYAGCFAVDTGPTQRARRLALPFLYEKSKSSVTHFRDYFPDDAQLTDWSDMLNHDLSSTENSP